MRLLVGFMFQCILPVLGNNLIRAFFYTLLINEISAQCSIFQKEKSIHSEKSVGPIFIELFMIIVKNT